MKKGILAAALASGLMASAASALPFLDWTGTRTGDPAGLLDARRAWVQMTGAPCLPARQPPIYPAGRKVCLDLEIRGAAEGRNVLETWWMDPWGKTRTTRTPFRTRRGESLRVYGCLVPPRPRWGATVRWRVAARLNGAWIFQGEIRVAPRCPPSPRG